MIFQINRILPFVPVFLLYHTILSCNMTYFIKSNNKICTDETCSSTTFSSFVMTLGQKVCFINTNNTLIYIKLTDMFMRRYYKPLYKTCNYQIHTASHTRCWHAGSCSASECTHTNKDDRGTFPPIGSGNLLYQSGCVQQGLCPGWCGFDQSSRCLWVQATVNETDCYLLYTYSYEAWSLNLMIRNEYAEKMISVDENRPEVGLGFDILFVLHSKPQLSMIDNHILEIESGIGIPVIASGIDNLVVGQIGVYQKTLDNKHVKFPLEQMLTCHQSSCSISCDLAESPI